MKADVPGTGLTTIEDMPKADLLDTALCARVRNGDDEAFGQLFDRHNRAIYNFCFRRVGNWSLAEDLLSIVFLTAWRRREDIPDQRALPWLYGIATNVVRNQHRDERRFRNALRRVAESEQQRGSQDVQERLDDERNMTALLQSLKRLSQNEQDVLVLCAWTELSYEDAAFALGVPIGTIRSRLARARAHLRELEPVFGHIEDTTKPADTEGGAQ